MFKKNIISIVSVKIWLFPSFLKDIKPFSVQRHLCLMIQDGHEGYFITSVT